MSALVNILARKNGDPAARTCATPGARLERRCFMYNQSARTGAGMGAWAAAGGAEGPHCRR